MNTFYKIANAIANQYSFSDISKMHGVAESKVIEIANSLHDPDMAYQMQIEQNFFDKYSI